MLPASTSSSNDSRFRKFQRQTKFSHPMRRRRRFRQASQGTSLRFSRGQHFACNLLVILFDSAHANIINLSNNKEVEQRTLLCLIVNLHGYGKCRPRNRLQLETVLRYEFVNSPCAIDSPAYVVKSAIILTTINDSVPLPSF